MPVRKPPPVQTRAARRERLAEFHWRNEVGYGTMGTTPGNSQLLLEALQPHASTEEPVINLIVWQDHRHNFGPRNRQTSRQRSLGKTYLQLWRMECLLH